MADKIQFDGENYREVCAFVTGQKLQPFQLAGGFWQRQRRSDDGHFVYTLVMPAKNGEVDMAPGDWAVRERDGWVRLSPGQMEAEQTILEENE